MASPDLKLEVNTELASRRTGMSFQRTRMSADRTLMSVIRTSLSLIGFGFTLAQVGLGIVMLVLGIVYHVQFMVGLRHLRESMREEGLIHGESGLPVSLTLITALILLVIGIGAIMSMAFHVGPFE